MFKNRLLRKIFGAKMEEVTGDWRKLQSEELYDLYCSADIIRVLTSMRMRHGANIGEKMNAYKFWWGNLNERDFLENLVIDGRVIVKCILKKRMGGCELDSSGSGKGQVVCCCEHGNEPWVP